MTQHFPDIRFEIADGVATITLDKPEKLNALGAASFTSFHAALDAAEAEGARALLVTGSGRAFCSGADLAEENLSGTLDLGKSIEERYNPLIRRLADLAIPVVTAVNGPAAGAGAGIALMGDISVMARSAYFQLAFVNIGLVPDAGTSWLVAQAAGRTRALEMALLGEKIGAEQAYDWGLVTRVADDEACLPTAQELAAKLAKGPTRAIAMIRKQVRAGAEGTLDAVLDMERDHQRAAGRTADFREGVMAFLQKREAQFKGE